MAERWRVSILGGIAAVVMVAWTFLVAQVPSAWTELSGEGRTMPAPADAPSTGDDEFDARLQARGISFQLPTTEPTKLTSDEAIALAQRYRPELARAAKGTTAEFVLFTDSGRGIQDRPVWLVSFQGAAGPRRGGGGPLPPVLQTLVLLDGLTGDVISLISMGRGVSPGNTGGNAEPAG